MGAAAAAQWDLMGSVIEPLIGNLKLRFWLAMLVLSSYKVSNFKNQVQRSPTPLGAPLH
jgi:hypothetical protein